jgi:hypothetical protein
MEFLLGRSMSCTYCLSCQVDDGSSKSLPFHMKIMLSKIGREHNLNRNQTNKCGELHRIRELWLDEYRESCFSLVVANVLKSLTRPWMNISRSLRHSCIRWCIQVFPLGRMFQLKRRSRRFAIAQHGNRELAVHWSIFVWYVIVERSPKNAQCGGESISYTCEPGH